MYKVPLIIDDMKIGDYFIYHNIDHGIIDEVKKNSSKINQFYISIYKSLINKINVVVPRQSRANSHIITEDIVIYDHNCMSRNNRMFKKLAIDYLKKDGKSLVYVGNGRYYDMKAYREALALHADEEYYIGKGEKDHPRA